MWLKFCFLLLFCFIISSKSDEKIGTGTCVFSEVKSRRFTGYLCKLQGNNAEAITSIDGEHVDGKSDDDVTYVSAPNLTTTTMTSIYCDKYKNMERFSIFNTEIAKVNENALENCRNLEFIEFNGHKITEVPDSMFATNSKIWLIKINKNPHLTTLPENLFANLPDFIKLFAYRNAFSSLPKNIFKFNKKLKLVDLGSNKLTTIHPEWFENTPDLDYLNLADNQILELPKNMFVNLQKLPLIWLDNNKLSVIHSDSFGVNLNFEHIYVQNNSINAIDERFVNNTGITKFDMTGNVCSQEDVNNRFQLKDAFQNCYDNYKPRKE